MFDNSIICLNCNRLQDQITILERDNSTLRAALEQRDSIIAELYATTTEQTNKIQSLLEANQSFSKIAFGSRSEKGHKLKNKLTSANDPDGSGDNTGGEQSDDKKKKKKPRQTPNRSNSRKIPKGMPTVVITHTLSGNDAICSCCENPLRIIGYKTSQQIDIIPAKVQVIENRRAQYACHKCKIKKSLKLAPLPIGHANILATPNLLSWIIVNKYDYHLPLYRQIRMLYDGSGYKIPSTTINSWILRTAFELQPIVARLIDIQVAQSHLYSDDTTVKTIVEEVKNGTKTCRLWTYISKEIPIVIYDFTVSREGIYPQKFLKNFSGYLQTDAYSGYYALYEDENGKTIVIPVFCMAHCRRKFFEISELCVTLGLADEVLAYIKKLYAIEDDIKLLSNNERYQQRQSLSVPILNEFNIWLNTAKATVLPGSKLDKAINYTLNHWIALTNYCLDGRLEIDNNRSERKMRGPKVGMNNYMFYGSESGGKAAAIFLSVIETCKENNISPFLWLADVIPKLHYYKSIQIDELLPHNWAKQYENINQAKVA